MQFSTSFDYLNLSLSLDQSKTLESDTIMQQNVCCARRVWPVYGKVPVSRSLQLS